MKFKNNKETNGLFTFHHPHSIITEQFRTLRALGLRLIRDKNLKTILVTSTIPSEGKSFVASNLAASIAQGMDDHVLLVDADIRRPYSIDKFFNLKQGKGLSDFLFAEHSLDDLIQSTEIPKLSVLSSGPGRDNPSELLASKKMKYFVQEVGKRYEDRYIIIDSAPVHPTSDPITLAEQVDGIILVIKAGLTGKDLIRNTVEVLGREKVLGIVLNYCRTPFKTYYNYYNGYSTYLKKP